MIRWMIAFATAVLMTAAHAHGTMRDPRPGYTVAGYTCDDIRAGIVLLGGYAAAMAYLKERHEKLDRRKIEEVTSRCRIDPKGP